MNFRTLALLTFLSSIVLPYAASQISGSELSPRPPSPPFRPLFRIPVRSRAGRARHPRPS